MHIAPSAAGKLIYVARQMTSHNRQIHHLHFFFFIFTTFFFCALARSVYTLMNYDDV